MNRPEQAVQKAVISHLRQRGVPGLLFWHTDNNVGIRGRKGAIQGAIKKSLGVRAGVPDILALHKGKFFALELKAEKQRPTEAQLTFLSEVRENGGFVCVAQGLDQALGALEMWGLVRGQAA